MYMNFQRHKYKKKSIIKTGLRSKIKPHGAYFITNKSLVSPQLLNQFENTGPPPADREKIKNLPTVQITEEHVGESPPAERAACCCTVGETSG